MMELVVANPRFARRERKKEIPFPSTLAQPLRPRDQGLQRALHRMGDIIADGDAENPLFAAPMQLLQPDPTHHFLVPVPETMEQLNKIDSPVNIITGVCVL